MVGSLLSVLLMGMLPVSGFGRSQSILPAQIPVAAPLQIGADVARSPVLDIQSPLSASGLVVMDLDSGQTLYSKQPDEKRAMASLTKLMTALLIVEGHDMNEWVHVPEDVYDPEVTMLHLPPGNEFRVGDLLKALLIGSSNEAANSLAIFHSGSVDAFVEEMNERAQELGLTHTTYANPTGFDDPDQKSSARDLAWLAMYVLRKPEIKSRMSTNKASITSQSGVVVDLTHTHQMLHDGSSVIAGKTGTTDEAGQCLLSIVRLNKRTYVTVLLNSADRYADMRAVLSALSASRDI